MATAMVGAEGDYVKAKTVVWWDIENCEVPKGFDKNMIAKNVCTALLKMNYCGSVSITACGDTDLIPPGVLQALSSTGVSLNHVPAGVKDASDKKILVDMLLWAVDNPAPANIMLISGDRDFSNALHQLSMRRYNILLAQPPHASAPLVAAAKNVWLWTSLASGGPPITSVESSPLLNKGSNNEVSKHQVSEKAHSSKPTDSSADGEVTNDQKTGENNASRGNFLQNGRAQGSVSAKPIQEAELVEPVVCNVCQIRCTDKDAYRKHTYGKIHQNNLELQSGKSKDIPVGLVEPPKEVLEKQKQNKNTKYVWRSCNLTCQSQIVFDSHLNGQKHASMVSQSEVHHDSKKLPEKGVEEKDQPRKTTAVPKLQSQNAQENAIEKHVSMVNQSEVLIGSNKFQEKGVGEKDHPREAMAKPKPKTYYRCRLCNVTCPDQRAFDSHLKGKKHTANVSQSKALIDCKKLQELSVGKTVVETRPQSQNAQEKMKCLEKHVAMVNHSEALIKSRKLDNKSVKEEAQPIKTITEPRSQTQSTQEHIRKVSGTSESSVKEHSPSIKDEVKTVNRQLPNGEFEVPGDTGECFDGTVKPVNLYKGVHGARPGGEKLRSIAITDTKGLSTVLSYNNGHWTGQKDTMASASYDAESNVSTKPVKEPEVFQIVWCQICETSYNGRAAFTNHTYSKTHRQKLELLSSAKNKNMSKGSDSDKFSKALVGSRKAQEESDHGKGKTKVQAVEKIDKETKEKNVISETSKLAFTELKRESLTHKESRHPLDGTKKSWEPEKESAAGRKEHPGEVHKKEEIKGQVDNFWTRLWGKKT